MFYGLLFVFVVRTASSTASTAAEQARRDFFELPYTYLIRGDEGFGNLAPNMAYTSPTIDSAIVVRAFSLSENGADTAASDAPQALAIQVHRPAEFRIVVADSVGTGLIVYVFDSVPIGNYTVGAKSWPKTQANLVSGRMAIRVFVAADRKLQRQFVFEVDAKDRLIRSDRPVRGGHPELGTGAQ